MGVGVVGDVGLAADGAGAVPRNRQDHASAVAAAAVGPAQHLALHGGRWRSE
ncbi:MULTISPECIES: hypothetical protein [Frankia]|uniref:hypothetical protein n=1 Tax=Frankia TaxID=1854 RepID=UPI0002D39AF6|nr:MULTISPECIES: hypothetical protein [Frankia]